MSVPCPKVGRGFEPCLKIVFKCGEEVIARLCLRLVDCDGSLLYGLAVGGVPVDECDGLLIVGLQGEYHLEEGVRDTNLMFVADIPFLFSLFKDGSAADEDFSLLRCPASACPFEMFPPLLVECGDLRADVLHVEAVGHGFRTPFHVGGRTHVPTVVA